MSAKVDGVPRSDAAELAAALDQSDSPGVTGSHITPRLISWIAAIAALVIALAVVLLTTDVGAGIFARLRCASVWVTSDKAAYRACTDVEREQTIEQRRKTPED